MRMQSRKGRGRGRGRGRGEGQGRAKATGRAERRRKVAPRSGSGLEQGISGRRQYGVGQRCRRTCPPATCYGHCSWPAKERTTPRRISSFRFTLCLFEEKMAGAGERKAEQTVQPTGLAICTTNTRKTHTAGCGGPCERTVLLDAAPPKRHNRGRRSRDTALGPRVAVRAH
jgi:hypothetical protein